MSKPSDIIKKEILSKVKEYYLVSQKENKEEYKKGDKISYGGRVFNSDEMINLVDSALEFWLTTGSYAKRFEEEFAAFLGVTYCSLTNSGSSANLLAFMALTSAKLGERCINRGDEIITVAAGFPTTIAPIVQYGAIPVFVDITVPEYNIDITQLELAKSHKTKAVMVAHTLGNPFNLKVVRKFCDENNLWLVEDNCDALGSKYLYNGTWHYTGTVGDIGTSSFYPPHHMTMGEGGAVYTNNINLKKIIDSFRDWGRDCWCLSGNDDTCKHRFSQKFGELPVGYDHKYVYSHFGYNLKVTDMQAAIGCAQLKKLLNFIEERKKNWGYLKDGLQGLEDYLILPEAEENANPSWFGFLITVKENISFTRNDIIQYLERNNIQTRMLFAGNIIKHPCFDEMRHNQQGYRQIGNLENTNMVMNNAFWIGVYPEMTKEKLDYMIECIYTFIEEQ